MTIDPILLDLVKSEEGFSATPYKDVAGVWTIGYGHTGVGVKDWPPMPESEAAELLAATLRYFESGVRKLVRVPLTRLQLVALTSFAYNLGLGALGRSTLLRLLNAGDYEGAAAEFRKWRRAGGAIQPGLLTRRGKEEMLFRLPGGTLENPTVTPWAPEVTA